MTTAENRLTVALERAADGGVRAVEEFYETLLASTVFVIERPVAGTGEGAEVGGEKMLVTVDHEGRKTLPIFSEAHFAKDWFAEAGEPLAKNFTTILNLAPGEGWVHLNPGQDVGKELSSWELEQLRKGPEAIPEIAAVVGEDTDEPLDVRSSSDLYLDLKVKLRPILEIYPGLKEAFLVTVREEETSSARPIVGLRYGNISAEQQQYIRQELEQASVDSLPPDEQLTVIDDLGDEKSFNWSLFSDANPFYIAQEPAQPATSAIRGLLGRALDRAFEKIGQRKLR